MNRILPVYLSSMLLLSLLLLQLNVTPVQSIALSNLCGQFGHSCFGGNWGKRELFPAAVLDHETDSAANPADEQHLMPNYLLEENLFRERLRQLFGME